jgi:hypothetical protein
MKAVCGLFDTPQSAERAIESLRRAGASPAAIVVMSSEPLDLPALGKDRRTVMPWVAAAGAGIGLTGAFLLTSWTQQAWVINTGGMPAVTIWTNLIVMFELTMLGAVLATTLTFLRTARLPTRLPPFYDPAISQGKILVAVTEPGSRAPHIEDVLRLSGPESLKTCEW